MASALIRSKRAIYLLDSCYLPSEPSALRWQAIHYVKCETIDIHSFRPAASGGESNDARSKLLSDLIS